MACIIPTYNGEEDLIRLLSTIDAQDLPFDLYIVDSDSKDGTAEIAACSRARETLSISPYEFNHGGTRQLMVDTFRSYDIYVYLTQDAYLAQSNSIRQLVSFFDDTEVGAVCGRQLAHLNANPLASHARFFNYPNETCIKSMDDASILGVKTAFLSNSFAAYRSEALHEVGGFPSHVILSEDMYVAANMLKKGWKIAYAGDACCHHSHNYTAGEEFKRYFDIGVFHGREAWIRKLFGGAGGEGIRYVISELRFLGIRKIHWWPRSLLACALKLVGYKVGQQEKRLPLWLKRKLSMHKRYWDGPYAEKD